MELRILGPLEIVRQGAVLPPPANKPRALLVLLLVQRGRAVSVDELADDLWAGGPPATATKSIQVYVSQLRKALGEGVLETRGRGYALVLDDDAIDAVRFERALEDGARLNAEGRPGEAAKVLAHGMALWRGQPLADFAYESWAQEEIARLEDLRLEALQQRIQADLALGRHGTVIAELQGLVERHPGRERLLGQLMLALYRSGRQEDALAAYHDQRRRMDEELGIEPTRELRELEAAILRQDPELRAPARSVVPLAGRRPRAVLVAVAAAVLVGAMAAVALTGGEDDPPAPAAVVQPMTGAACSPMSYQPGSRPEALVISDQPLRGPLAVIGTQVSAAVEFVLRGHDFTVGDLSIAYQACDSDRQGCRRTAELYAENPDVIAVIGPLTSECATQQIPVANRVRPGPLALVSATNTRVGLTRPVAGAPGEPERFYPTGVRNYVRVLAADDFQAAALAMLGRRLGARRIAIIAGDADCRVAMDVFGVAAQRLGIDITRCKHYIPGDDPARAARAVIADRPDAVFIGNAFPYSEFVIHELGRIARPDLPILGQDGFSEPDFVTSLGPAADGMRVSVPGVDPDALVGPERDLIDDLSEAVGEPHPYTVAAVQATELLLDALERSDGTRTSVVEELFASEVRGGVLGDFSVTPTGDTTANRVTLYRIEEGELVLDQVLTPPLSLVAGRS